MSAKERVQHGAQKAGHASIHDEGPLRVGRVQVADQQQLCHKVSGPHHQPSQKAGHQADQGNAAVRTFGNKTQKCKNECVAILGAEPLWHCANCYCSWL